MKPTTSAPLLSRVKAWQLVGLGISGWITLYSVAVISWGASSFVIGNAQGACFAITMTLAGLEVKRLKKGSSVPVDPLQWTNDISTEQLNQILTLVMKRQELRVELPHEFEAQMGFGVRAVSAGRTLVFETGRWKEAVIDLLHAQTAEENRKKALADQAIIIGAGSASEDAKAFVKIHSLQLLAGQDLKNLIDAEKPPEKEAEILKAN